MIRRRRWHPKDIDLLAYVDEDLSDEAREAISEHLKDCRLCRVKLARLEAHG